MVDCWELEPFETSLMLPSKIGYPKHFLGGASPEQVYFEPHGVPHKRIGVACIPPMLEAEPILNLSRSWRSHVSNDVLIVISPGHMPDFRILQPLMTLVGDPLADDVTKMGELGMACNFRTRLLESAVAEVPTEASECGGRRLFFTCLHPRFIPLGSFHKIVVLTGDPRFTIMREAIVWNFIRQCCGLGEKEPNTADFLQNYLQYNSSQLAGEEVERIGQWAHQENLQPEKVKLVCMEDFIAETSATLQDLARFLGVQDAETLRLSSKSLQAEKRKGFFYPCAHDAESEQEHHCTLVKEFETLLAGLPASAQTFWNLKTSTWPQSGNRRMTALGLALQRHDVELELIVSPSREGHLGEQCRPCSYFFRNTCRSGESCSFCHDLSHGEASRRPSKKERDRRKRQTLRTSIARIRTPSPSGLSS